MCAIDLLINKTDKNEDEKIILNQLIEKDKALCEANQKLRESNIEKAKLSIALI